MRLLLFPLIVVLAQLTVGVEGRAQTPAPSCPSVTVESKVRNPPWAHRAVTDCLGAPVTFTAKVAGVGAKEKYTFHWTVSEGEIIDGQGTSTITVATGDARSDVTATVELVGLRGLKPDCNKTAQASVSLGDCHLPCTSISLACPTGLDPGTPATVSADVSGGYYDGTKLKYNWAVSAGVISAGQGTPSITIDTTNLGGQDVKVTLEVEGLPPECDRTESCTMQVMFGCGLPLLFDRYGDLSESDERTRLDTYSVALREMPSGTAYVIVSGGVDQAVKRSRLDRIKHYLAGARGIDPARIETVEGDGTWGLTVELYILLPGAVRPQPAPNY
jgi:PKD-like domain